MECHLLNNYGIHFGILSKQKFLEINHHILLEKILSNITPHYFHIFHHPMDLVLYY